MIYNNRIIEYNSIWNLKTCLSLKERERERDRQTDTDRESTRDREEIATLNDVQCGNLCVFFLGYVVALIRAVWFGRAAVKSLTGLCSLLRQKHGLDVWQHTALSDGHPSKQLV